MIRNLFSSAILKSALGASALLLSTTSAHAVVSTFATFTSLNSSKNISLVNAGPSGIGATVYSTSTDTATSAGVSKVQFSFIQPGISTYINNVVADFTLNANITKPLTEVDGTFTQPVFSGTMTFLSTTAITFVGADSITQTLAAGSNLLTLNFNAKISGDEFGSTATFGASTAAHNYNITYTSDFLDFSSVINKDFSTSFTALTPALTKAVNGSLDSFRATIGGQFSSDPAPLIVSTVPEPASWALMVTGFMMLGVALRQRRSTTVAAA